MWKVGDKLRFIKNGVIDCTEVEGFKIGNIYEIIRRNEVEYDEDGNLIGEEEERIRDDYIYKIEKDGQYWVIEPDCFEKVVRKNPEKETDYLDNIRENFRFGY